MQRSHCSVIIILIALCTLPTVGYTQGNEKLAQTGFQFLSVVSDARASGLGDAVTTLDMGSGSLFFNPAGMARMTNLFDVRFNQNRWLTVDITHNAFSFAFSPANARYGVLGVSLVSIDYGEIQGTMVWKNDQGFVDTEIITPTALAGGIGYARALSDKFSVGGQVKAAYQSLGRSVIPETDSTNMVKKNIANATAFDFGTIYLTGYKSLAFGMSVRNFSEEIKFEVEGFQLPLTFRIGISMDVMDIYSSENNLHSLIVSIDAVHPRSYPEYLNIGMEYKLRGMLAVRNGYMFNRDEQDYTIGIGLRTNLGDSFFALDYSTVPFGLLDKMQIVSMQFSL